jgi:hypothetical protein
MNAVDVHAARPGTLWRVTDHGRMARSLQAAGACADWPAMRALWVLLGVLWLGAVTAGLASLAAYDNRPGVAAVASARWPAGSRLVLDGARPTLVMLAHPRCSCTRASLGELAELMARSPRRPKAYLVFVKPGPVGATRGWDQTDLWDQASRIPGVTVVRDDDGREAALYGAETSGQTFLYGPDGALLFSGGTTGARGHPGDNAGRASLLAILRQDAPVRRTTSVFGCSLFAPGDRAQGHETHEAAHAHPHAN